jgi:hypothetical protein
MRAHEKMLLNSKLMQAEPFLRHYGVGVGCALGMIEGPSVTTKSCREFISMAFTGSGFAVQL